LGGGEVGGKEGKIMAEPQTIRVGFVTPISSNSPHFEPFKAFIPAHVEMDFEGLGIVRGPLESLRGTGDVVVETSARLVRERGWQGVIVSGAPVEVMNPGLLKRLQTTLAVPVTTALESCVRALKAFSARRVLLLTPFVESLNSLIREYLSANGIVAFSPSKTFDDYKDAMGVGPEDVYALAKVAFARQSNVDAIYFQGAVLDPLKILDRLETDVRKPVVASNPAMLWRILSMLEVSCSIPAHGRLLREWPEG
jgi:maleate isomerase